VGRHFRIADFGGARQVASVRTSLSCYQWQTNKLIMYYSQRSSNI
jgi:hypothetical protein